MRSVQVHDRELIRKVATLLCDTAATLDSDFMFEVCQEMEKRGYTLECRQRGIYGTHVLVVRV